MNTVETTLAVMENSSILTTHRDWTGDLNSLVEMVSTVHSQLWPGTEGSSPNIRLIRHYQSVGCVSKPQVRIGTKGTYTYRELLEAVSVRVLLDDGWKLAKIGEILTGLQIPAIESLILRSGIGASKETAIQPDLGLLEASAAYQAQPQANPADEALSLIASFQKKAGLQIHGPPPSLRESAETGYRANRVEARKLSEFLVTPWLRIVVDEGALAKAEPGLVVRALTDAIAVLNNLKR